MFCATACFTIAAAALRFILLRIAAFGWFLRGFTALGPPVIGPLSSLIESKLVK